MISFNLYQMNIDESKSLVSSFDDLISAQNAINVLDKSFQYSIEQVNNVDGVITIIS